MQIICTSFFLKFTDCKSTKKRILRENSVISKNIRPNLLSTIYCIDSQNFTKFETSVAQISQRFTKFYAIQLMLFNYAKKFA